MVRICWSLLQSSCQARCRSIYSTVIELRYLSMHPQKGVTNSRPPISSPPAAAFLLMLAFDQQTAPHDSWHALAWCHCSWWEFRALTLKQLSLPAHHPPARIIMAFCFSALLHVHCGLSPIIHLPQTISIFQNVNSWFFSYFSVFKDYSSLFSNKSLLVYLPLPVHHPPARIITAYCFSTLLHIHCGLSPIIHFPQTIYIFQNFLLLFHFKDYSCLFQTNLYLSHL